MGRIEFSKQSQRIIAERAGHVCSYPNCGKHTSGPDGAKDAARSGIAAHIFSASPDGPRGRGGLTDDEIADPANGIWLCTHHAREIDNNKGFNHPPEVLLSYKGLHENRIQKEHLGVCPLIGWLHEVRINKSGFFKSGCIIRLSKLNVIYGANAVGKSILARTISGIFDNNALPKLRPHADDALDIEITYFDPSPLNLRLTSTNGEASYSINGTNIPFNPLPMKIVSVSENKQRAENEDDVSYITRRLGIRQDELSGLFDQVNSFAKGLIRNAHIFNEDGRRTVRLDLAVTIAHLDFEMLSSSEQELVFVELASAMARIYAKFRPTLLILDGYAAQYLSQLFETQLLDPISQFQTLMCVAMEDYDFDSVRWQGWEMVRLCRDPVAARTSTSQVPRPIRDVPGKQMTEVD